MQLIYVLKSNGEKEAFSLRKVFESALRSGAQKDLAMEIAETVKKKSYPGIKTSEIFRQVNRLLKKNSLRSSLKFNLKRAMKELGPTGFPFEKYVGEIFKSLGFETKINQIVPGRCISDYEIDFIARSENLIYVGECKYRNVFSDIVDQKDALANYARFLDIKEGPFFRSKSYKNTKTEIKTILVTNGKFTSKALGYSRCKGVDLLGWRYPKQRGLEYLAETKKLYPITILPSLKGYMKSVFVNKRLMLLSDIVELDVPRFCRETKLQEKDVLNLAREAKVLLEE